MSARTRLRLAAEFLVLYVLAPASGFVLARAIAGLLIPILVLLGAGVLLVLLADPSFDRRQLGRGAEPWRFIRRTGALVVIFAALASLVVWLARPEWFLALPRRRPGLWLLIMLLYPLLSVYPQELYFRTFLFHRYGPLFRDSRVCILASASSFSLAHLMFGNWAAPVLTFVGGLLFAATYRRTRSTVLVSLEHACYGWVIFTVGLGRFFYLGPL